MNRSPSAVKTRRSDKARIGVPALTTAVAGISISSLFYKLSYATGWSPFWVNITRIFFALCIMTPMTFFNRANRARLRHVPKRLFWLSALSGTLLAFHFTAWAIALNQTDVFAATAISGTNLLITALFSSLFLHEKTSVGALAGMLIATAGVVVCNLGGTVGTLSGNLYALLSAVLLALYTLCGRKARAELDVNTYTAIVYSFTFVWMALMVWTLGVEPAAGFQPQNLLWALGLAIFPTLLGHTMQSVSLKYFKAPTVSAVLLVNMILSPLIVFLALGDVPTRNTFFGGCVIIVGIVWYIWMELRDEHAARGAAHTAGPLDGPTMMG